MLDTFKIAPGNNQHCWWMLAGVVDYKLCDHDFDCEHCPFDSILQANPHSGSATALAEGDNLVANVFYHPAHVWVRVEDRGNVRVGLDNFAQSILGRIYAVALPHEGLKVEKGKHLWGVTHKAGETPLIIPLSGLVLEVNWKLRQSPSLLNLDPYGDGWAFVIKPIDLRAGLRNLFYGSRAVAWQRAEMEKLAALTVRLSGAEHGTISLPDGGKLRKDFLNELSSAQIGEVISCFLPGPRRESSCGHSRIPSSKRR